MKRTYKLIASRGNEIVFDDRIQADTPRNARRELKKLLGLKSLSGIVYSITEIPVDLIREIVDARIAELAGGAPLQTPIPADVEALVMERLKPILAAWPRWNKRRKNRPPSPASIRWPICRNPPPNPTGTWSSATSAAMAIRRKTATKYGIPIRELNARAKREGWAS